MLPIRDNAPTRTIPWVIAAIVLMNVAALAAQLIPGVSSAALISAYGLIPARFMRWAALGGSVHDPWRYVPLATSMFLHDGWLHLVTNMVYLWVFGRALEARLGRGGIFAVYGLAGLAAALGQLIAHPHSNAAMIGASGAIAGLLGAYLVFFPRAKVTVAFPFMLLPFVVEVRAAWFLLAWFGLQVGKGTMDLAASVHDPQVAWWAHATGFLAGVTGALAGRMMDRPQVRPTLPPRPTFVPPAGMRVSRVSVMARPSRLSVAP